MQYQIDTVLGLLVAVAVLAVLARRFSIPYPILLVIGGLGLAFVPGLPRIRLEPDLVFLIFLPPLLFPAALFTSWRDFRANLRPISLLALGLVLFTTCSVGWLGHFIVPGLPLAAAFILGAIISPPDAVAATAIVERLRVPQRIVTILEGESLVNDATALVAYAFAIDFLNTGSFSLGQAAVRFLYISLGGILIGLIVGWLVSQVQRRLDDPPVQITISLLTPFAAYLPADQSHMSGVLAVVACGLYLGWRSPEIVGSRVRLQAGPVWEMAVFLLNGLVFILIGLQLPEVLGFISSKSVPLRQLLWSAAAISVVVIAVRFVWVFAATYLPRVLFRKLRERDPNPPWQNVCVIAWTGMRGVVSLAAALYLPARIQDNVPGRDLIIDLIIFLTFVVILVTLVLQGLTLPWLIRRLNVVNTGETDEEEREARLKANLAAMERLAELETSEAFPTDLLQRLRGEYDDRLRQLEACDPSASQGDSRLFPSDYVKLQQESLRVERKTILQLRNERAINDQVLRHIQRDLDLAEARLQRRS
jgi:CPA1 family monovalent cation:H+ antiporter